MQRLQARELALAQLEQTLGRREVFEPVLAQIASRHAREEVARRLRQQNLPTVTGCGDPRRPMDVQPDVSIVGHGRLTSV
ncbi:MAG TPA: hypothetical protein VGI77_10125 [Gaiellaceae bacterium]